MKTGDDVVGCCCGVIYEDSCCHEAVGSKREPAATRYHMLGLEGFNRVQKFNVLRVNDSQDYFSRLTQKETDR